MEQMREVQIMQMIESLEILFDESRPNLFTNKVGLDKEEVLDRLGEIKEMLPQELAHSIWVLEERNRILSEAQREAATLIEEANKEIEKMINQHEITRSAEEQAELKREAARKDTREMYNGAIEYADDVFKKIEQRMKNTSDIMHKEFKEFEMYMGEMLHQVQKHRHELRDPRYYNKDDMSDGED